MSERTANHAQKRTKSIGIEVNHQLWLSDTAAKLKSLKYLFLSDKFKMKEFAKLAGARPDIECERFYPNLSVTHTSGNCGVHLRCRKSAWSFRNR